MLKITVVIGNPKPRSRTAQIATTLVDKLFKPGSYTLRVIDLADHVDHVFTWPSEEMAALNNEAAESDLIVVASPTYKATYTGLLKAFLDRYPHLGLSGVVAIPVMTGADLRHAMGAEVHLRPLLVELGAIVPAPGLYFVTSQMDRMPEIVAEWAVRVKSRLESHLPATLGGLDADLLNA
ncbi:NADPH-dependent FMN reductase [Amycolatopsis japonica]